MEYNMNVNTKWVQLGSLFMLITHEEKKVYFTPLKTLKMLQCFSSFVDLFLHFSFRSI